MNKINNSILTEMNKVSNLIITEEEYNNMILPYQDALSDLQIRIEVLNNDFRRKSNNYPIHHIQTRIKSKNSIINKLDKNNLYISVETAMQMLTDIAGIRIICYLESDVYSLISLIKRQSEFVVIKESDYIANPKPSGYRSYHLVLGVPVYHTDGMQYFPVEIQIRTMAMDFWASMEHRVCYKSDLKNKEKISKNFQLYASYLNSIEKEMESYC